MSFLLAMLAALSGGHRGRCWIEMASSDLVVQHSPARSQRRLCLEVIRVVYLSLSARLFRPAGTLLTRVRVMLFVPGVHPAEQ